GIRCGSPRSSTERLRACWGLTRSTTDHLHPTGRGHRAPHPPLPVHKPPGNAVSKFLFPDHTVDELAQNIQVAVVPGGLLDHVDQDPTQGRSPPNIRNTTGEIGQFEFGDDLPGTSTLSFVFIEEFTDGLRLTHPPLGVGVLP